MTGSVALDVVIGLVFIYLLYSLLATIIQEIISSWLNLRANDLEEAIKRMLDDHTHTTTFSKAFYRAPLIRYLAREMEKPSYLTSANFSKVVLDILKGPDPKPGEDFRQKIDDNLSNGIKIHIEKKDESDQHEIKVIDEGSTLIFLQSLWAESQGDVSRFRQSIEQWFDDTMDRTSGWYKRKVQKILFGIGFVIAVLFNVDSVDIAKKLASDPVMRQQLVEQANNYIEAHPDLDEDLRRARSQSDSLNKSPDDLARLEKTRHTRDSLNKAAKEIIEKDIKAANDLLGIGLHNFQWKGPLEFFKTIAGWILTAFAISLGAPFWFDLLNKLMKLRSSVAVKSEDSGTAKPDKKTIIVKG